MTVVCPLPATSREQSFRNALDRELLTQLVHEHLLESSGSGPIELQPDYVRWKESDGSIVGWRVFLGEERLESYVTARTAARERLADNLTKIDHHQDRAENGLKSMALVSDHGLLLIAFPIDRQMGDLRRLVRASKVRSLVTENRPDLIPESLRISKSKSRFHLVRYKPERRAVLRWDLGFKNEDKNFVQGPTVWLRTLAAPLPQRDTMMRAAQNAGVRLPAVLSAPHDQLLLETNLEGSPWQPGDNAPLPSVVATLAQLHRGALPPNPPRHDRTAELELTRRAAEDLMRLRPNLGAAGAEIHRGLTDDASREEETCLLHGDFHQGQVLLAANAGLCDFDRACAGPAAVDLAAFQAHAIAADPEHGAVFGQALVEAYGQVTQLPRHEDTAWWTAAALLRMAITPFRRLRADWPDASQHLLSAAAEALRKARR